MKHYCHDPFCTKNLIAEDNRSHRAVTGRKLKKKWKSPRCTAAIQLCDRTVGGIHPWRRCMQHVGPGGDTETMRCRRHRPGSPGESLPTWGHATSTEVVSIQP